MITGRQNTSHIRVAGCFSSLLLIGFCGWLITGIVLAETSSSTIVADERAKAEPPAIVYRRLFVPAGKIESWPREGVKLIPIEAQEFDRSVEAANRPTVESHASATIDAAEYSLRVENHRIMAGRGKWSIRCRGGEHDSKNSGPQFLPLGDISLVIHDARWRGRPQFPARIGVWGMNGGLADTVGLEVPQSGEFEFNWSARVNMVHDGLEIPWRLPVATSTRLILDLPEGMRPSIDGGVVISSERIGADQPDNVPHWRWEMGLDSSPGATLRIVDSRPAKVEVTPTFRLHEDVRYDVTRRGLDIEATWKLDVSLDAERELIVAMPEGLHFISATAGKRELVHRNLADSSKVRSVVIELPERIASRSTQVTIRAWQPIALDKLWRLPKLRPRSAFWMSGNVELSIAPELELRDLARQSYIDVDVSNIGQNATGDETWKMAAFSPAAEIDVTIGERRPASTVWLGSSLALADADVSCQLVTKWEVAQGSLFNLSGELGSDWVIEAVETSPAEALGEWFIDQRNGGRNIHVQLARAVDPSHGLTITINGRLQRSKLGDPAAVETMRMVRWNDVKIAQHLLTFQTNDPYAVEPVGGLASLPRGNIRNSNKLALLDANVSDNMVFDLAEAGAGAGLKLVLERGQYDAEIRAEKTFADDELHQAFRLVVNPTANRVDGVLVYSTTPLGDVQWTESHSGTPLFAERVSDDDLLSAGLPQEGELWRISLPRPTVRPFEVSTTVTTPWTSRKEAPLLAMPEAVGQQGRLFIRSAIDDLPRLEVRGLQASPLPSDSENTSENGTPPVRSAYRYSPVDCLDVVKSPRLWIEPIGGSHSRSVIVRNLELESFYWPDGGATHRAAYSFQTDSAAEVDLPIPSDATLKNLSIDGKALTPAAIGSSTKPSLIRLPGGPDFRQVSITFDTPRPPLRAGSYLRSPLEESDLVVLDGLWTIWLPNGYVARGPSLTANQNLNWRQRLFGPFGRPDKALPFDPTRGSDWSRLLGSTFVTRANTASSPDDRPGWRSFRSPFNADVPAPVVIANAPATTTWAICIFLVCFVSGQWIRRRSRAAFIVLLAIAASLALLLPDIFVPLATGAVLGLIVSLTTVWPRKVRTPDASRSWSRLSTVTTMLVLVVFFAVARAYAEPNSATQAAPSAMASGEIHRLLIPVDEAGRPAGSKYYVSEKLLRELMRFDGEGAHDERRWVILEAVYTGELRDRADASDVVAGDWTMTFTVDVLARDTTVALPLVRSEAVWPVAAMLDGVPTPITWAADGRSCAIDIPEPGQYSLVISCVPKTIAEGGQTLIGLSIPAVQGATLKLQPALHATALTVSGIRIVSRELDASQAIESNLGTTNRINVHWTRSDTVAGAAQAAHVTGMRWLHIGTNEVTLEAKFIVEENVRRSEELLIAFDQSWRLLRDETSSAWRVEAEPDGTNVLHVPQALDAGDRHEIALRWRLAGAPSLGRLYLPPIEVRSIPLAQRWLAVSTDPELECFLDDGTAAPGSIDEFLTYWGSVDADVPQFVLENIDAASAWSTNLALRPEQVETTIDEELHVAVGRDLLRVVYQADVTPGTLHRHQFALEIPENFSIDEVAILQGDDRLPLRWARAASNRLTVFYGDDVADGYRLIVSGTRRVAKSGDTTIPRIKSATTDAAPIRVQLYREHDTLVNVRGLENTEEPDDASSRQPPLSWTVRHLGSYRLDKRASDAAKLSISANDIILNGDVLTSLSRDNDVWSATYTAKVVVQDGLLDALKLRLPSSWAGPFELESSMPASFETSTDVASAPTLSLRFAKPLAKSGSVSFSIRSPLNIASVSTVSVPAILSDALIRGHRYAAVPTSLDGHPLAWSIVGADPASVPEALNDGLVPVGMQAFEIVADPFRIALESEESTRASARIRLAETTVYTNLAPSDATGGQLMVTRFVVESQGLSECTLQLPPDQQLVYVQMDGRPANIHCVDTSNWQVSMAAAQLPSNLEIVSKFNGPVANRGRLELRRPELLANSKPIAVELSLWSLGYPRGMDPPRLEGAAPATALDFAGSRFDRLLSIAETATPVASKSPVPDGWNWFRPWAALLERERKQALDTMENSVDRHAVSRVARPAEEQVSQASQRMDEWLAHCNATLKPADIDPAEATTLPATHGLPLSKVADRWIYCIAEGGADRLSVTLDAAPFTTGEARFAGVFVVIGIAVLALVLIRIPSAWDVIYRWPHAVGFLIGLVCWAWLWPSWVGLLVAGGSLLFLLRSGWPGRLVRLEGSTVLRPVRPV